MNELPVITQEENPRRAHCSFCGGVGDSLKAERVTSVLGMSYRVPLSHASCKRSILSLSLSLDFKPARKKRRKER
jgi:hypothetical protein